jgi:hypothetical protein
MYTLAAHFSRLPAILLTIGSRSLTAYWYYAGEEKKFCIFSFQDLTAITGGKNPVFLKCFLFKQALTFRIE